MEVVSMIGGLFDMYYFLQEAHEIVNDSFTFFAV